MKRMLTVAMVLVGLTGVGGAQQTGEPATETRAHRIVLFVERTDDSALSEEDRVLLYESILAAFAEHPRFWVVEPSEDAETGAERSRIAWQAGGDMWLGLEASGDLGSLDARVLVFDLLGGRTILDVSRGGLDVLSRPRVLWREIVRTVEGAAARAAARDESGEVEVRLLAVPGTRLTGATEEPLVVNGSGEVRLMLPPGTSHRVRAERTGYRPSEHDFFVAQDGAMVRVPQQRAAGWTAGASLTKLAYPGVSGSYLPVPDTVFLRLSAVAYGLGLRTWEEDEEDQTPLLEIALAAGIYAVPIERNPRLYAGLGAVLRLSDSEDGFYELDNQAIAGFFPVLGLETQVASRAAVYLELSPRVYVLRDPEETREYYRALALLEDERPSYVWFGDLLGDLGHFSAGLRYQIR